jgi:putative membrane protein
VCVRLGNGLLALTFTGDHPTSQLSIGGAVNEPVDNRFPARVYGIGTEPDPRFTLANERTFLAWIRTALALLAGGVALEALGVPLQPGFRLAASLVLVITGAVAPVQAWFGWIAVERSMRESRPLPSSRLAAPVAVSVGIAGVLVLLGIVFK